MLKTLPSKNSKSDLSNELQPKNSTLNAILNFSRSLDVKKIKKRSIYIINN